MPPSGETSGVAENRVRATDGQGRLLDPADRHAVEMHAMDGARAWLLSLGWTDTQITDTSTSKPYDYLAARDGETLYVEVKGTTGEGTTVFVTEGEVEHAISHPGECALFVLRGITLKGGVCTGGAGSAFLPWDPREGLLKPIAYRHTPATSPTVGSQ